MWWAQLQARLRRHRLGAPGDTAEALFRLVRGPHRLPAGGCGHGAAQPDGLHAQPPAHGGGQLSGEGPGHRLARGEPILRSTSTTSTWPPTTAAGSGPAPAAATRSPISASSTRSARARSSTRRASSSAATCRSWQFALQFFERLQTIGCQHHTVAFTHQQALRDAAHRDGVVNHQHQRRLTHRCRACVI
jgi:hypothetical protein